MEDSSVITPMSPKPQAAPVIQAPNSYPYGPDRVQTLESELKTMQQRMKWHTILWWMLFFLIVLCTFAIGYLSIWDTRELRREHTDNTNQTNKRVDDVRTFGQDNLNERTRLLENRLDRAEQNISALQSDMSALKAKFDALPAIYSSGIYNGDK